MLHADLFKHKLSFQIATIGKEGDTTVLWKNTWVLTSVACVFKAPSA